MILGIVVVFVVTMYDVLFDLMLTFAHFAFEWLEFGLDHLIELIFHTTRQQTQVIVFYLLVAVALFAAYWLWLKLVRLYRYLKLEIVALYNEHKARTSELWEQHHLSVQKLRLLLSGTAGIMVFVYFVFS